jgi:serralysin
MIRPQPVPGDHAVLSAARPTAATAGPQDLPVFTNRQIADYIREGFWRDFGEGPRQFNLGATGVGANDGVLLYNVSDVSPRSRALAEAALALYEQVLDIDFVRTESNSSDVDIHFFDAGESAYTEVFLHGEDGAIGFATVTIGQAWLDRFGSTVGSYAFQTYIHEIGHALGLGHAGPYDGFGNFVTTRQDPKFGDNSNVYANDSWQGSMMSYFSQVDNLSVGASFARLATPMAADWLALGEMYGFGPRAYRGDTVWGFGGTATGPTYGDLAALADRTAFTIVDMGGRDVVDFSGFAADQAIDLAEEAISSVGGLRGNMSIARGTVIEAAVGGAGDDDLRGNAVANALFGGAGKDTLWGRAGGDRLDGGAGADVLRGGDGNDLYLGVTAGDRVVERAGEGRDTIRAMGSLTLPEGVERLELVTTSGARGVGNAAANTLVGGAGPDQLRGLAGGDVLWGGAGADRLVGGLGADVFVFRDARDSAGAAQDRIVAGDGAVAFERAGAAGGDVIDVSGIDANLARSGDQDFGFGGRGIGRLWTAEVDGVTVVRANLDRDRAAEFSLRIQDGGRHASAYDADDFLL